MADIQHEFPINASCADVFRAVSTPAGLDRWWTLHSAGDAATDAQFTLDFGPGYVWRARVSHCEPFRLFEFEFVDAMPDWSATRVRFELEPLAEDRTLVRFSHAGWDGATEHYRASSFCWAMYLRIMRRALEYGEDVPYEKRLEV